MPYFLLKTESARAEKGFTLIEVVGVMIVVTFGLLALISMKVSAMRNAAVPDHALLANRIVQKVGERILQNETLVDTYHGMRTATNEKGNCPDQPPFPACFQDFSEWRNAVSALPQGDLAIAVHSDHNPKKVDVDLRWHDQSGSHRVKLPFHLGAS